MGRSKTLSDSSYPEKIARDLKSITDSNLVIKLMAIQASLTNKEADVARIFNVARSSVSLWINKYKKLGLVGLRNKSRGHNPSKLTSKEKETIKLWIKNCKDSKGNPVHWTLQRLIKEIALVYQKEIKKTPLWITLHKMELVLKKPRPKHYKTDDEAQEDFKKNPKQN